MAVPKRLTLNGKQWTIEVVPGLAERENAAGWCIRGRRVIQLDASQSDDEKAATLLHELLHAAWPQGVCTPEQEERVVRRLEKRLHPLLGIRH